MFAALILGFGQLAEPATRRLLVRCVFLSVATFGTLLVTVAAVLSWLGPTGVAWLDAVLTVLGSATVLVLAWLLLPATIIATAGWFADEVIVAVEQRHYPGRGPPRPIGLAAASWAGLRFAAFALVLNLLALPLYLLPGPNFLVYLALNGYLLGREYFQLVAERHLAPPAITALRRAMRGRLWLAGALIAALSTLPILNLCAPIVALSFMVHLFERWQRDRGGAAVVAPVTGRGARAKVDRKV